MVPLLKSERSEIHSDIVKKFREFRLEQGLSLAMAASQIGCTKQYLFILEKEKQPPTPPILRAMSLILFIDAKIKETKALQENFIDVF